MSLARQAKIWSLVRDMLLVGGGLFGVIHATITGASQPNLLILYGGMMGLPIAMRKDNKT